MRLRCHPPTTPRPRSDRLGSPRRRRPYLRSRARRARCLHDRVRLKPRRSRRYRRRCDSVLRARACCQARPRRRSISSCRRRLTRPRRSRSICPAPTLFRPPHKMRRGRRRATSPARRDVRHGDAAWASCPSRRARRPPTILAPSPIRPRNRPRHPRTAHITSRPIARARRRSRSSRRGAGMSRRCLLICRRTTCTRDRRR